MEDRDYRSEVGKKIEEALANGDFDLIEDLIEVPPMETFMQWAEKGEEKRKKRICRKKILVSCIALAVVSASVFIGLKCFALPEVTADPEDSVDIELNDMESVTTYKTWDDLPDDIKEQFIKVKDFPEGYVVEKVKVAQYDRGTKIIIYIRNDEERVEIRQLANDDGTLHTSAVSSENANINIDGKDLYMESDDELKITTYKFANENIMIDVVVPLGLEESEINSIIKTVL